MTCHQGGSARVSSCSPVATAWTFVAMFAALGVNPCIAAALDSTEGTESKAAEMVESPAAEASGDKQDVSEPPATFLDTVTVTTTRSERTVGEVAGATTVVSSERIERELMTDIQDLVRYEPGVYVDSDVTRLGLNGFNIRGVGGNRVLTQIDGIPTAEQFDFGPFSATQTAIDLESIDSVEIVKSAGSSLYGSDALGGVVSLVTKDPSDYLGGDRGYVGLSAGYYGRDEQSRATLTGALGGSTWQGSLTATLRGSGEADNQGTIGAENNTRTEPNPIDSDSTSALGKLSRSFGESNELVIAVEVQDRESETDVLSSQRLVDLSFIVGPFGTFFADTQNVDAIDSHERFRASIQQSLVSSGARFYDSLLWRIYGQDNATDQQVLERRVNSISFGGPPSVQTVHRDGGLTFDQESLGGELQVQKAFGGQAADHFLTYGFSVQNDQFDVFRNRVDLDADTGQEVPSSLIFPTRYFPLSDVQEIGVYLQDEVDFASGRLKLIPGLRFDSYDLDPDENDDVFLSGNPGQPAPESISDSAISPKLGILFQATQTLSLVGQYARGFRAPPYSEVNNGFTNQAGGYTTLPNPDLEPETSDNFELGLRGSFSRGGFSLTYFDNRYDDFIEITTLGFNPSTFLLEFQAQNVNEVEISGVEFAGDLRIGDAWRLRSAIAVIEGDNLAEDRPLGSIAPSQAVVGADYRPRGSRWGASVIATLVDSKDQGDLEDPDDFAAPSYEVLDLTAFVQLNQQISLQVGLFNLLDETYWNWSDVRGRAANDPVLDRYTSSGFNAAVALRYSL